MTDGLLAAMLSPPCAACGQIVSRSADGALCDACWRQLELEAHGERWPLAPPHIDLAASLGSYEGALRLAVHALKYEGRRSIASRLARLLGERCGDLLEGADAVVPVPLHPLRRWTRGFNQSEEIAGALGAPPVWKTLRRTRRTPPQASLTATAREANVHGAFAPRRAGRAAARMPGSRVVLLDDVATTGATLSACAVVLRRMGAAEVLALTAARTLRSADRHAA
jgi:ComF family protein